ncbi:MAG TPA: hypothetical protein VNG53_00480 [Bacteroidia bacterium]|nr:hypothetical protein [Bacteroidia bacterium]
MTRIISIADIQQIKEDVYGKESPNSDRSIVANFEKHKTAIDSIDCDESEEVSDTYLELIGNYGLALARIKKFKKAIQVLTKAIELLRNDKRYTEDNLREMYFYELLLDWRSNAYHNRNKEELAKKDYEILVNFYPENTSYSVQLDRVNNQIRNNKNRKFILIKNLCWYVCLSCLFMIDFVKIRSVAGSVLLDFSEFLFLTAIFLEVILYFSESNFITRFWKKMMVRIQKDK